MDLLGLSSIALDEQRIIESWSPRVKYLHVQRRHILLLLASISTIHTNFLNHQRKSSCFTGYLEHRHCSNFHLPRELDHITWIVVFYTSCKLFTLQSILQECHTSGQSDRCVPSSWSLSLKKTAKRGGWQPRLLLHCVGSPLNSIYIMFLRTMLIPHFSVPFSCPTLLLHRSYHSLLHKAPSTMHYCLKWGRC